MARIELDKLEKGYTPQELIELSNATADNPITRDQLELFNQAVDFVNSKTSLKLPNIQEDYLDEETGNTLDLLEIKYPSLAYQDDNGIDQEWIIDGSILGSTFPDIFKLLLEKEDGNTDHLAVYDNLIKKTMQYLETEIIQSVPVQLEADIIKVNNSRLNIKKSSTEINKLYKGTEGTYY